MSKYVGRFLGLLLAITILLMPVTASAKDIDENSINEEIVIEDEETPLYSSVPGNNTYGAYIGIVAVGALVIFGIATFIQESGQKKDL